jgi:dipeptidyl aminopeptidase/acylaminoacyl peptidase
VHELGNGVSGVEPAWSPNGSEIAFSGGGDIWTMNADGSNAHQLGAGIAGDEPAWSPDGGRIVFRNPTGLAVIGADGTGFHQLTIGPDDHPSWSPDGTTIAFGSDRDDPYVKAHEFVDHDYPELYLVNHDGGNLRPLSFTQPSAFEQETTFLTTGGRRLPALPGLPALAGRIAAVGGTSSGRDVITLYDATTGKKLAAVPVGTAHSGFSVVGADAHWVVFRVGRALSALDTHSHRVVRLTTAAANLLDPSVSGRRVAWAENRDGQGRIRALELPS